MSTHVICEECGSVIERYEDSEPLVEVEDGTCEGCRHGELEYDPWANEWMEKSA